MSANLRPAMIMLLLALAGCGSTTPDPKNADETQNTGKVVPAEFRLEQKVGEAADCEGPSAKVPEWALKPETPLPSENNLSGMWFPIAHDSTSSGALSQEIGCYDGLKLLTLQQDGARLKAVWVFRDPASGAEWIEYTTHRESAIGQRASNEIELKGQHITIVERMDSGDVSRDCTEVNYVLRWDGPTKHLVGTRNGEPIRFAPFNVKARTTPCGDPPA